MSSPRRTTIPAIPTIGTSPRELTAFGNAIKEATEVAHGRRGDPLDRFVSVRDLKDAGLVNTVRGEGGGLAVTAPPTTDPGAPIFDPGDPDFGNNDYSPPPAPTNVAVHHIAPNGLMVTWDPPAYDHHDHAEVFRMPQTGMTSGNVPIPPVFNLAAAGFNPTHPVGPGNVHPNFAGRANGTIFSDVDLPRLVVPGQSALDAALNPSTYYYWVRFVSTANVVGPYAPPLGASGALSIDPNLVLGLMITNVTNSQAYHTLLGLNPSLPNPILDAGGVSQYINAQDNILHGSINQQLVRIIGTSDNPVGPGQLPTVYAALSTLTASTTANSAELNQLDSWQAALGVAANTNTGSPPLVYAVSKYARLSTSPTQLRLYTPVDSQSTIHLGDNVTVTAGTSALLPINGSAFPCQGTSADGIDLTLPAGNTLPFTSATGVATPGAGVSEPPAPSDFVNLIASIFHNVYVHVDPTTAIGQEIGLVQAQIGALTTTVSQVTTAQQNTDGTLDAMWSVGMQTIQGNGLVYAAGFGLGLQTTENDDGTFETLSTFLINANQFAVMGTNAPGALINSINLSGTTGSVQLSSAGHGIVKAPAGAEPNKVVFAIATGRPRGQTTDNPISGIGLDGMSAVVTGVSGANISVAFDGAAGTGAFPSVNRSGLNAFGNALMPATNIPFIIDTTRGVVGIRGKLIVDGLVRATTGDFDTLTAGTAFINSLQAQIVNANVVIGQRLIAGTAGAGALTDAQVNSISNYIIEMANPVTSTYPLRFWKPSTGVSNFDLDRLGNIRIGGNLSVGRNAVMATTGANLTSIGGSGSDGSEYPLWIGPRSAYGTAGEGRSEVNGLFWVKDDGRAGFNTSLFLGDSGLMQPALTDGNSQGAAWVGLGGSTPKASSLIQTVVSSGQVNITPTRSGGAAKTMVIVSGNMATTTAGTEHKGYMLKATLTGSSSPVSYDGGFGGDVVICEHVVDDTPVECQPYTLMGAVRVPPGHYWVRINIKTTQETDFSLIKDWNVFAQQVV